MLYVVQGLHKPCRHIPWKCYSRNISKVLGWYVVLVLRQVLQASCLQVEGGKELEKG
jgi:hypothetical protein